MGKHGFSNTTIYYIWANMKYRCLNPNDKSYRYYGGRGIKVCDRWLDKENGFINFLTDMGLRPSSGHSLDRIDPTGNYCPENCRWATYKEQANNRTNSHIITFNGKTQPLLNWAEELGIGYEKLFSRLYDYKWDIEKAFTAPHYRKKKAVLFTHNGESLTITEWSRKLNINFNTLYSRIYHRKWPIEKALSSKLPS